MPIYHLRRTATVRTIYSLRASTEEEALDFALDTEPDVVEDEGDGEWTILSVEADPEPARQYEPAELPDCPAEAVGSVLRSLTTLRAFADVQDQLRALADHYDPATED